jgi:prolipoprotein diacylglyceryltransferase
LFIHTVFDLLAWISGGAIAWFVSRKGWLTRAGIVTRTPLSDPMYFIVLGLGAISGALFFGSLNLGLAGHWELGHSIAGAICGAIILIEVYKIFAGIHGSTGLQFVAPLALGIAVGRLGCFFSGLPDFTYGTPTTLPWGVDFGDGIPRHPVQLYEAFAMLTFLGVFLYEIAHENAFVLRQGSYLFIGWYALQRFMWEFLKPYPTVIGPLNVFHLICGALLLYCFFWMGKNNEPLHQAV